MRPIGEIAEKLGLDSHLVVPYGHYQAKVGLDAIRSEGSHGKVILVTGITPTPAGEGKTTTAVGLTDGLAKIGKRACVNLREPSFGLVFGIKGGGTGGGKATVEPQDEINLHFTGDEHAVSAAHNLLAALTDNAANRGKILGFDPSRITWRRVTDVEDRALRTIVTGIGGPTNAPVRETGFDMVTASEIMAILALSDGIEDLRRRLSRIVVGFTGDSKPVTAQDIEAVGSMMALLRHAMQPNLVQTCEGQPALVHTGPFGNIAHGCSSVIADRLAMKYVDYVVTEAGFGADLGFEKFMHIKARDRGLEPSAVVLVSSTRALKVHGGVKPRELEAPNEKAVTEGVANLEHMVGVIRSFGLPVVVAVNRFPFDTEGELAILKRGAEAAGAHAAVESRAFEEGGDGAIELAEAVADVADGGPPDVQYLYPQDASVEDKVLALAQKVYNADSVWWSQAAQTRLRTYEELGWGTLPVCMAKTHLSLSHDRTRKGRPSDYTFEITDVRASVGAGFIYPIAGNIATMPGLPSTPHALEVDAAGNVLGL